MSFKVIIRKYSKIIFIFLFLISIMSVYIYAQEIAPEENEIENNENILVRLLSDQQINKTVAILSIIHMVISLVFILIFNKNKCKPIKTALLINIFTILYSLIFFRIIINPIHFLFLFLGLIIFLKIFKTEAYTFYSHSTKSGSRDKRFKNNDLNYIPPDEDKLKIYLPTKYTFILLSIIAAIIWIFIAVSIKEYGYIYRLIMVSISVWLMLILIGAI